MVIARGGAAPLRKEQVGGAAGADALPARTVPRPCRLPAPVGPARSVRRPWELRWGSRPNQSVWSRDSILSCSAAASSGNTCCHPQVTGFMRLTATPPQCDLPPANRFGSTPRGLGGTYICHPQVPGFMRLTATPPQCDIYFGEIVFRGSARGARGSAPCAEPPIQLPAGAAACLSRAARAGQSRR